MPTGRRLPRMNDVTTDTGGRLLWEPTAEAIERTTMTAYARWLQKERGLRFDGYHELWQWSVDDIEAFWASIWDFFEVQAERPYERVLGRREMPGAEWFPGAGCPTPSTSSATATTRPSRSIHESEARDRGEVDLGRAARADRRRSRPACASSASEPGDRVVALPAEHPRDGRDVPRVRVASARSGRAARRTSASRSRRRPLRADRAEGAASRSTATATAARTSTGARSSPQLQRASCRRSSTRSSCPTSTRTRRPATSGATRCCRDARDGELTFEQLPFDHPLWVLYSSGTTGLPKAIVHGQGGILLEHLKTLGPARSTSGRATASSGSRRPAG